MPDRIYIEAVTADEVQLLNCAMAGNFPGNLAHLRHGLLRKLARAALVSREGHECDPERPCEPNDHLCRNYRAWPELWIGCLGPENREYFIMPGPPPEDAALALAHPMRRYIPAPEGESG